MREETFDDLFIEDLSWAHAMSIYQLLKTEQFDFAVPFRSLLQRGLQDQESGE